MIRTALISGAGIAGGVLAWELAERGLEVTVVEKATGQRSSGNPVDVYDAALLVAERMGVADELRPAATSVRRLVAVNRAGKRVASLPASVINAGKNGVEVPRAELAGILVRAAATRANIVFDESIAELHDGPGGVDVTFESGRSQRYDLVIGADGQHSRVRSLAFGPERLFAHRIGMFVATVAAPGAEVDPAAMTMLSAPGRSFSLHPSTGIPIGAFIFHSRLAERFDSRTADAARSIVADAYSGLGWRVPEFVERFLAAPDVYFDAITQIRLDAWHRGRIALLGDAASSVSLFGDGSSTAIVGANTLADAVSAHPDDPAAAFADYERRHRLVVGPKQNGVVATSRQLVPRTAFGLGVRNTVLRGMQAYAAVRFGRPGTGGAALA
jgi:2-polyprenyl-6-methoxyphenol hydroxylase-like FAD-dependent oxidoreductase